MRTAVPQHLLYEADHAEDEWEEDNPIGLVMFLLAVACAVIALVATLSFAVAAIKPFTHLFALFHLGVKLNFWFEFLIAVPLVSIGFGTLTNTKWWQR